jgi:hypothetical protein
MRRSGRVWGCSRPPGRGIRIPSSTEANWALALSLAQLGWGCHKLSDYLKFQRISVILISYRLLLFCPLP